MLIKVLCHAVRADCLLMKQLGCMHSRDKFKFANACHHLFKCIQRYIFESNIYVGMDVLVVSLQSVLYCLPTLPFVLFYCWMSNLMPHLSVWCSRSPAPHVLLALEPLPMIILTHLPSATVCVPLLPVPTLIALNLQH